MPPSESDDENLEELEFDVEGEPDGDADADDEPLDIVPDDATEGRGDDSVSDDSDDGSDEEEDDDDVENSGGTVMDDVEPEVSLAVDTVSGSKRISPPPLSSRLEVRTQTFSPAQLRKKGLMAPTAGLVSPGSYTVEAICALPHPVSTHALASSLCMTHLLTGSDDGYIRDYDIFASVNSKNFLTAPQRHHSGVVEGLMKSGQVRFWWANTVLSDPSIPRIGEEPPALSPVYSLAMHSDALWTLAGTKTGQINLYTVRHDPGRLCHVMNGHRGPVSALSMNYEEKGFFSAGWDGDAIQWDLNSGQRVRTFTAHGAQLAAIAIRPETSGHAETPTSAGTRMQEELFPSTTVTSTHNGNATTASRRIPGDNLGTMVGEARPTVDSDAKSDVSFDPLFDDEQDLPDGFTAPPSTTNPQRPPPSRPTLGQIPPPKNAPSLLDTSKYATYSPDLLMTASIDGQVILWDCRVHSPSAGVGRLWMSEKTPPWCLSACWSADGGQIFAGRRNGTVDVWDVRQLGESGPKNTPRLLKTLRNPPSSGVVSCVVAFPDCRHIACASIDNLRLWNVADAAEPDSFGKVRSSAQFKIIPGHHGGYISQMLIDPGARFLVSASSNRGWHGESTKTVFVHDIKRAR